LIPAKESPTLPQVGHMTYF